MSEEKPINVIRRKKIIQGHGGHHGGAWKVAYADFVTAMMAFFLVMWLMGSDEETKEAIAAYFQNKPIARDGVTATGPFAGGNASGKSTGAEGRFEEKNLERPSAPVTINLEEYAILKDLSSYYEGSAFTVQQEGNMVNYMITPRLRFDLGDVSVLQDSETRTFLIRMSDVFKQHDGVIVLVGFPDATADYPLAFGRAMSTKRALEKLGVLGKKLVPSVGFEITENNQLALYDLRDSGTVKFILKRRRASK